MANGVYLRKSIKAWLIGLIFSHISLCKHLIGPDKKNVPSDDKLFNSLTCVQGFGGAVQKGVQNPNFEKTKNNKRPKFEKY